MNVYCVLRGKARTDLDQRELVFIGRKRGMIMFEFMYAKKIKKDTVMEVIDRYKDDYYIHILHKPNGNTEIFIGSKRKESEVKE